MAFPAKFPGTCRACNGKIEVGQHITKGGKGYVHKRCPGAAAKRKLPAVGYVAGTRDPELARMDAEYAQGLAEGERYMSDVKLYGRELAEEWEMDAELARYNRGEDY